MLLSGHVHTFRASVPTYLANNMSDSLIHFNVNGFSPIMSNNPSYYIFEFWQDFDSEKVGLNDIISYEVDLSEFMTRN